MKTIFKYIVPIQDNPVVEMHGRDMSDPDILAVQMQGNNLCVWAMVDDTHPMFTMPFRIVGTGHPLPNHVRGEWQHVGTVQQGPLVWHLFVDWKDWPGFPDDEGEARDGEFTPGSDKPE